MGNSIIVSELASVEIRKVLIQHYVDRRIGIRDTVRLRNDFLLHLRDEYFAITVDIHLLEQAAQLMRKHALLHAYVLRSMDAIQLACAVEAVSSLQTLIVFVSGDQRLLKAAANEGFQSENPEHYP